MPLYLVFGAVSAYFIISGLAVLFDPRITHVAAMHGRVAIEDNGNRFVISMMQLGIGVVGVVSLARMALAARKEAVERRWQWQVAVDRQLLTRPSSNVELIAQDVTSFDGQLDYCMLLDRDTESCIWCYGEPDRRVVEARLNAGPMPGRFVVSRQGCADTRVVEVRAHQTVSVAACDVLTGGQALEILLAFRSGAAIPQAYVLMPRRYTQE